MNVRVNAERLCNELSTLGSFSAPSQAGGVTRRAWSQQYFDAEDWLVARFEEAGLRVEIDSARNIWGKWAEGVTPAVVTGSHIDSVPSGGRFDGCLGVLGALAAVRALQAAGHRPTRQIWVVAWMEEEGSAFGQSLFGSRAFTGELDIETVKAHTNVDGSTLDEVMSAAGHRLADLSTLPAGMADLAAYLELHIEQGPILDRDKVPIGVVTDIVGIEHATIRFTGRANHAGCTPMNMRQDASLGLARGIAQARRLALEHGVTATTGQLSTTPGATNVIPDGTSFSLDARHPDSAVLNGYAEALTATCHQIARDEHLDIAYEHAYQLTPVPLDTGMRTHLVEACAQAGVDQIPIVSGAGHDAMVLAPRVPTGMFFVPSRGGISHAPDEYSSPKQCATGAEILALTLAKLTRKTTP